MVVVATSPRLHTGSNIAEVVADARPRKWGPPIWAAEAPVDQPRRRQQLTQADALLLAIALAFHTD